MATEVTGTRRRPIGVWVICLFYALSAVWSLFSFTVVLSGAIPLNPAQHEYLASQTNLDWFLLVVSGVLGLSASVSLFLLRRVAIALFSVNFALGVILTIYQSVRTNLLEAAGGPSIVGMLLGWLIAVAVILYARMLAKRGVLT